MIVVTGAPFSGKGQFVRSEIARRERDGELGLLLIGFTELYSALVPGIQSSYRDENLTATGAPRFVGALFNVAVRIAAERELDGYIATDEPRRAVELSERLGDAEIVEVQATELELSSRARAHLSALAAQVPRARLESRAAESVAALGKCTQAMVAHFRDLDRLAGKARGVRAVGKLAAGVRPATLEFVSTGPVRLFNRTLWLAGLTGPGKSAVTALIAEGVTLPLPGDVMKYPPTGASMTTEIRCAVELRADDGSPGRLFGVLLNYGERAGGGRSEVFEPGALSWPAGGIVLKRQHERSAPIMRLVPEVRGDQVVVDAPLPDSAAGRDAASEIRSGLMTGLSVEFHAQRQRYVSGVRHVLSAVLAGAGLVHNPEYAGSAVEVREQTGRRRFVL